MVLAETPIKLSATATGITSSSILDLLDVTTRAEVISLAGGLPAPESFPVVEIAEVAAEILATDTGALQYSTTNGYGPLRHWVAERHDVEDDAVVITHGSQQALELVVRAMVDPGGVIAMADPGYLGAVHAMRMAGARLIGIPEDNDGLAVDVLADRLAAGHRPALVYVVPNFHNPTGTSMSLERRQALADLADRYAFVIVDDDPYGHLRWSGESLPGIASFTDRVISLGTISKVLCPGMRVGWAIGPKPVTEALALLKQGVDLHTSTLAQRIVHRVVTRPGFLHAHVSRMIPLYRRRAEALAGALRAQLGGAVEFEEPEGGMFIWARLPGVDTDTLLPAAVVNGVAFVPGSAFAVEGCDRSGLRLSYATVPPGELDEAVCRLVAALDRMSGVPRWIS